MHIKSKTFVKKFTADGGLTKLKKALADYDKAIELDQNYETAKNNRQRVLDKLKK